jgi:hypothetical protein
MSLILTEHKFFPKTYLGDGEWSGRELHGGHLPRLQQGQEGEGHALRQA